MTESEARISLAVVGEDHLHALLAKKLTDHRWLTLAHNHDAPWLEALDQHRRWYVLPHLGGAGYLDSHKTGAELWPPKIKPRLQRRLGGVPLAAGPVALQITTPTHHQPHSLHATHYPIHPA